MKKLEFNIVVYKVPSEKELAERERLEDLGLEVDDLDKQEQLTPYSIMPEKIVEYKRSRVHFGESDVECVMCTFLVDGIDFETPPLVITYEEFEQKLIEYFK